MKLPKINPKNQKGLIHFGLLVLIVFGLITTVYIGASAGSRSTVESKIASLQNRLDQINNICATNSSHGSCSRKQALEAELASYQQNLSQRDANSTPYTITEQSREIVGAQGSARSGSYRLKLIWSKRPNSEISSNPRLYNFFVGSCPVDYRTRRLDPPGPLYDSKNISKSNQFGNPSFTLPGGFTYCLVIRDQNGNTDLSNQLEITLDKVAGYPYDGGTQQLWEFAASYQGPSSQNNQPNNTPTQSNQPATGINADPKGPCYSLGIEVMLGDVNGDSTVTATDALIIGQHVAELSTIPANLRPYGDTNGDGFYSNHDKTYLLQYLTGTRNASLFHNACVRLQNTLNSPTPSPTPTPATSAGTSSDRPLACGYYGNVVNASGGTPKDGRITTHDYNAILRYSAGYTDAILPGYLAWADINKDGKVNAVDAQLVAQYLQNGDRNTFPPCRV